MVNIAFVVFIDGQDTLFRIYVHQPPCNNNPYTFTGWHDMKIEIQDKTHKVTDIHTFQLPKPFARVISPSIATRGSFRL